MSRGKRALALTIALLVAVTGVLPPALTGALAVQLQQDIGVPEGAIGLSISVFFAVSVVAATSLGRYVDRFGWRRASLATATTSGICLGAVALGARDAVSLAATLAVGGVGLSLAMLTSNLVLAREMPAHRLGLTVGIKQAAVPGASLLAGLAVPALGLTVGWRWAFGVAVAFPLLVLAFALPRRVERQPAPVEAREGSMSPELLGLGAASALASLVPGSLTAYFVLSGVDAGLGPATAGLVLAVASIIGLVARVSAGWWADRVGSDGFRPAAVLLGTAAVGLLLLATRDPFLVVVGGIAGHGIGGSWGGLYFFGLVRSSLHAPATATGVVQAGGSTGVLAGPLVFAVLAEAGGHALAWTVLGISGVFAAALILVVGDRYVKAATGRSGSQSVTGGSVPVLGGMSEQDA